MGNSDFLVVRIHPYLSVPHQFIYNIGYWVKDVSSLHILRFFFVLLNEKEREDLQIFYLGEDFFVAPFFNYGLRCG